jgi:diguanylate cyclase (GGDEF)-like protein
MNLETYYDKACFKELSEIHNMPISEIINFMHECHSKTFYITHKKNPIYIFTISDLMEIFRKNLMSTKIIDYIQQNQKPLYKIEIEKNIIDAYYFLRNLKINQAPVTKNNEIIGEINFKIISAKIADIAIKDPLTHLYNREYFDVLLNTYQKFDKPIGIIFVELQNLPIIEDFYGIDTLNDLIKAYALTTKSKVRDIDFTFKIDNTIRVLTLNNLEITEKIAKRIDNALKDIEIDGIKLNYEVIFTSVPEEEENIFIAIERLNQKLIKRD